MARLFILGQPSAEKFHHSDKRTVGSPWQSGGRNTFCTSAGSIGKYFHQALSDEMVSSFVTFRNRRSYIIDGQLTPASDHASYRLQNQPDHDCCLVFLQRATNKNVNEFRVHSPSPALCTSLSLFVEFPLRELSYNTCKQSSATSARANKEKSQSRLSNSRRAQPHTQSRFPRVVLTLVRSAMARS